MSAPLVKVLFEKSRSVSKKKTDVGPFSQSKFANMKKLVMRGVWTHNLLAKHTENRGALFYLKYASFRWEIYTG